MAYIPAVVNNHLDAIELNEDGGLLLAASSLTNRYWTGSLWYYAHAQDAPDVEKSVAGIEIETGISDAHWIPGTNRIITGCDSGSIQLWELSTEETRTFSRLADPTEHDDIVTSVNINADCTRISSSSYDRSIRIWDLEDFLFLNEYVAHSDIVWGAVWHLTNPSVFISCSQDGKILLWDTRNTRPASSIDTQFLPSFPTCIAWQPGSENLIAIGTENGEVLLQDIRQGVGSPVRTRPHSRSVNQLKFSPNKSSWLASTSDDCTSVVLDITQDSSQLIARNTDHSDFVRGLSWHPKEKRLYTSGWDFKVLSQEVPMATGNLLEKTQEENMEVQHSPVDTEK